MVIERFAPSPTGYLHLGHAYSAMTAWRSTKAHNGKFHIRIEDLDSTRSKSQYTQAIFDDLSRLGINWNTPVVYQSERYSYYEDCLSKLIAMGLCFPCKCTRKDIKDSLEAPNAPLISRGQKLLYPGTCRNRTFDEMNKGDAIRLNFSKVIEHFGGRAHFPQLEIRELGQAHSGIHHVAPDYFQENFGDIVLARKDIGTSYHLSVVIDDAFMGITNVTRGEDIFDSTFIHRLLQELLELPVPTWSHHGLIRDEDGKRLAKRSPSFTLRSLWDQGFTSEEIISMADKQLC
ncbi:MAG: tRNA glutamyl-Q(34) synthetase GluQRS [Rhodobacteraceae bacterium]|nr:tRNA glutamyl-Q(34) synthetase GluQRS [Paracoccaceae bacterium]MCY4251658.1 tRNA glutamyl-Q(34) synthetase GluQRS [Paracoccaceae bacterium]